MCDTFSCTLGMFSESKTFYLEKLRIYNIQIKNINFVNHIQMHVYSLRLINT